MERQRRIALITGIILTIIGGIIGLVIGLLAEAGVPGTAILILIFGVIGYFIGIFIGGNIATPKENDV